MWCLTKVGVDTLTALLRSICIWFWDRGEEWGELLELETSGYDHMGPQCYCSDLCLQGFIFILLMTVPDAASWNLLLRF